LSSRAQVDYDEAVKLLVDLNDLSKKINKEMIFKNNGLRGKISLSHIMLDYMNVFIYK
jgi:hypothetical protein